MVICCDRHRERGAAAGQDTAQIIESLTAEGWCEIGELSEDVEHFIAWPDPLTWLWSGSVRCMSASTTTRGVGESRFT
jgi:hypothetical protein